MMIRTIFAATTSALVLAACTTTTEIEEPSIAVEPATAEIIIPPTLSAVDLAMGTVDELVVAGNTQTAIDRLTQLLGDARLTDNEKASVLARRGDLRSSAEGYDLMGAIADYGQVLETYPTSAAANGLQIKLDAANNEATSLNGLLNRPETARSQRFSSFFRLGQHNEALDLMLSSGLRPDNNSLIAMYQIGYLCSGDDQTGPSYNAVEPDGTPRELRFCDFGK